MSLDVNKLNTEWIEWLIVHAAAEGIISRARAAREMGISLSDFLHKYKDQLDKGYVNGQN